MQPDEFLVLASDLAKVSSAAHIRSAISRAYYAAFHSGARALRQLGFRVGKGAAAHGEVVRCLVNCADPETIDAANKLSNLHSSRIIADYQIDQRSVENADDAQEIVKHAQSTMQTFDRLPTHANRPQIHAAIAAWRKSNGYPS